MSLNRTIKTKIDEIGTGTVAANDDKTITGKKYILLLRVLKEN